MPVITCHITANDGPGQYLEDLSSEWWNLQRKNHYTDMILVSGENATRVHQAVLLSLSQFLRNLAPDDSCDCTAPTVILPSVEKDSLSALVELIYTGRTEVGSRAAENEVLELMAILQIEVKDNDEKKNDTCDILQIEVKDNGEKKNDTCDQNRDSKRKTLEKVDGSDRVERDESIENEGDRNEKNASRLNTDISQKINIIEGPVLTDLLDKTTREQKRKIEEIVNENNEVIPKQKKKRLDLIVNLANNNVSNTNVDLALNPIEGNNDANTDQQNLSDPKDLKDKGTTPIDKVDSNDATGEGYCENKLNQNSEKAIQFICPFCSQEFEREMHYKKHLSWYHFREEICEQFTGLDCAICRKSFVRKSEYVGHLGSAHKIIEGLMDLLFDAKMARMRKDNQPKALTYIKENDIKGDGNSSIISHVVEEGAKVPRRLSAKEADENELDKIVNENNENIPKQKKKMLDLIVNLANNNVSNINVNLGQDPIEGNNDAKTDHQDILDTKDFNDKGTTVINKMDSFYALGERICENKLNQSTEKSIDFICPFCSQEFEREIHYKKHLSWYHFREEISEQFTGLDCAICRKSFVRKSEYVGHLGSAHKIIEGLMDLLFDDKMAQMRKDNQPKALTYIKENDIKDDGNSSNISHVVPEG